MLILIGDQRWKTRILLVVLDAPLYHHAAAISGYSATRLIQIFLLQEIQSWTPIEN
jgi:hypothetical protein